MTAPSVEYGVLFPVLIVFGIAVAGVLVEAFLPRRSRYPVQVTLSLAGLLAAFVGVIGVYRGLGSAAGQSAAVGAVVIDRPGLFLQGAVLVVAILGVLLIAERHGPDGGLDGFTPQASAVPGSEAQQVATKAGVAQTEVFPLTMFAVAGMMLFGAAGDLLTMFIALEVLSLPLYLMCGLARHRRLLSQEAALKYFLLGAFSSAFFLYGMAMLYGSAGTLSITGFNATTGVVSYSYDPTGSSTNHGPVARKSTRWHLIYPGQIFGIWPTPSPNKRE
jgi:NADH-quinone oxidoreductase subunit N